MSVVDLHPQRQQIIEGILNGLSLRTIGRTAVPPIAHTTLAGFRAKMLQTAAKSLRPHTVGRNILKDAIMAGHPDRPDIGAAQRVEDTLRTELTDIVRSKFERRERWIKDAEDRPVLIEGKPLMLDGRPLTQMDHKALAAHDRNDATYVDLLARLGQLYSDSGESGPGLTAVMSFGGDVHIHMASAAAQGQAPQIIDVEPMDVGLVRSGNRR